MLPVFTILALSKDSSKNKLDTDGAYLSCLGESFHAVTATSINYLGGLPDLFLYLIVLCVRGCLVDVVLVLFLLVVFLPVLMLFFIRVNYNRTIASLASIALDQDRLTVFNIHCTFCCIFE